MDFSIIINELTERTLYDNIFVSLKNVLTGFTIAFVVALLLALLLYEFKMLDKIFYPIIEVLRPIPNAGWVPIAIIIFATIEQSIIFITFVGAFFPMFISLYRALKNFPINYLYFAKIYKLNWFDRTTKIILPGIMSNIFTALMIGISGAWLSVIMAEMISGRMGIGYYTWKSYTLLSYEKVFLGIIIMGILGALFSLFFATIAKKKLFWVRRID